MGYKSHVSAPGSLDMCQLLAVKLRSCSPGNCVLHQRLKNFIVNWKLGTYCLGDGGNELNAVFSGFITLFLIESYLALGFYYSGY